MSLNEIVNCPEQFVSSNPYIVVQHIDWIQCRYLFVQTTADQGGNNSRRFVELSPHLNPSILSQNVNHLISEWRESIS